jgi:hypothetical protein
MTKYPNYFDKPSVSGAPKPSLASPHTRDPGTHRNYTGPAQGSSSNRRIGPPVENYGGKRTMLPVTSKEGSYVNPVQASRTEAVQKKYGKTFSKNKVDPSKTITGAAKTNPELANKVTSPAKYKKEPSKVRQTPLSDERLAKLKAEESNLASILQTTKKEPEMAKTPKPEVNKTTITPAAETPSVDLTSQAPLRSRQRAQRDTAKAVKSGALAPSSIGAKARAAANKLRSTPKAEPTVPETRSGPKVSETQHLQGQQFSEAGGKHRHSTSAPSAKKNAYGTDYVGKHRTSSPIYTRMSQSSGTSVPESGRTKTLPSIGGSTVSGSSAANLKRAPSTNNQESVSRSPMAQYGRYSSLQRGNTKGKIAMSAPRTNLSWHAA